MPVVAVVNQKGGVGKTTIVLGLAAVAASRGHSVLVVDLDPQANATSGLAVWAPTVTVDLALAADEPGVMARVVQPSGWESLLGSPPPQVAPSSPALATRESQLATDPVGAQDRLRTALEGLPFDLVLIDCPPSLGLLTINGLFAADAAVVVTEPAAWSSDGVEQVLRTIGRVSDRRGGALQVAGIVVNRVGRTRDNAYWHRELASTYPKLVVRPVHLRAAVAEAAAQSLPVHALSRSGAAEAVAELDEVFDELAPRIGLGVVRLRVAGE